MKSLTVAVVATIASFIAADASAQLWGRPRPPQNGVCFYEDNNFGGRYFCAAVGRSESRVSSSSNDEISSIRVFGNAEVIVFKDNSYRGASRVYTSNVRDLRLGGLNDGITSYRVGYRGQYGSGNIGGWGGAYGSGSFGSTRRGDDWRGGGAYGGGSHSARPRISYAEAMNMVRSGYSTVLKRDPDPSGLASWSRRVIDNDWSQRDLNLELMKSDEFRQMRRK